PGSLVVDGCEVEWTLESLTITDDDAGTVTCGLPDDLHPIQLSRSRKVVPRPWYALWRGNRDVHLLQASIRTGETRLDLAAPAPGAEVAALVRRAAQGEHVAS